MHHIIPKEVFIKFKKDLKSVKGYIQNATKKAKDVTNLIDLKTPFHGNHPKYSDYVIERLEKIVKEGIDIDKIRDLQNELRNHIADALKSGKNLNDYFKEGLHKKPKAH